MPLSIRITTLFVLLGFRWTHAWAGEWELCPGVHLRSPGGNVSLSKTEEVLVCGDPDLPAWKQVPRSQAIFHLKTFLQDRGFYHPAVMQTPERVLVDTGDVTAVRSIVLTGPQTELDLSRLRYIEGEALTPTLLQATEKRVLRELRALGYGCPKVKIEGFPDDGGKIQINIDPGTIATIRKVDIEPFEGTEATVLSRYHAFFPGATFNGDWLALTTSRINTVGIVQNTTFEVLCDGKYVDLAERNIPGPPRIVTIGFGLNTEKGLAAKASWKHVRLGDTGSPIELSLTGYFGGRRRNEQELGASALWYYQDRPSRFHLKPSFSIRHESQQSYEYLSGKLQLTPGTTWEGQNVGGSLYAGPAINGVKTFRGDGRPQSAYLSIASDLAIVSHDFELYRTAPRSGYEIFLSGSLSRKGWLGEITAQTFRLGFHKLWNLGNYDPPLLVLGWRGSLSTTITPPEEQAALPPNLRHYLGGSQDLRGFGFQEVPASQGALSAFFTSVELRMGQWLPWGLQPLLFLDVARTGSKPAGFDYPWVYSPGGGLRWESPIGAFRASAAQGIVGGSPRPGFSAKSHFQLFVSYGEEF